MAYSMTMLMSSIILAPFIVIAAAIVFLVGRRLKFVPGGRAATPAFLLIACAGFGALYLGVTFDELLAKPARLQARYLGHAYAGMFALRYYSFEGFQDPGSEWQYALSPEDAAALRRRCLNNGMRTATRCDLYNTQDERTYSDGWIEGDRLHMMDGLH